MAGRTLSLRQCREAEPTRGALYHSHHIACDKITQRWGVKEDDGEWSMVSIEGITGYVKSSFLVSSIDEVTVEGFDLAYARENHYLIYTEPAPVIVRKSKSTGPSVYYCASGNVVKYHSSGSCRGLSRCSAFIDPILLSEAQASMNSC